MGNHPSPPAPSPGHVRVTFSLPSPLLEELDYLVGRLGLSRSAFLSQVLLEAVPAMSQALRDLPPPPATEDQARRLRGASIAIVEKKVDEANNLINGLFSGLSGGADGPR